MALPLAAPYLIVKPDVTEADFYRLADEDCNWEFLDGRIVMHSPASNRHEDLFSFLLALLRLYTDEVGGFAVRGSRYPMRLDPQWSPEPDLLVVRERGFRRMKAARLEGPADMVIEIASESDPKLDIREKLPRYRRAGIEEIWLIDRFTRTVRVEVKTRKGYAVRIVKAGRVASHVVPGFWIDAAWLWKAKLPSTAKCLRAIVV
jgi:Uma2 family endonuclease